MCNNIRNETHEPELLLILILLLLLNDASVSKRCSLALRVCLGDVTAAKACDNHANAWGKGPGIEKVSYQKDLPPDTIPRNLHATNSHQSLHVPVDLPAVEQHAVGCQPSALWSLKLTLSFGSDENP
ncbi:unnamed protein product [Fusarium graminearum]|nr:hypothetical protein FG05_07221 [Fusarium graminearum]CZS73050.1 unnamed protein product [Fusarium graminearum]